MFDLKALFLPLLRRKALYFFFHSKEFVTKVPPGLCRCRRIAFQWHSLYELSSQMRPTAAASSARNFVVACIASVWRYAQIEEYQLPLLTLPQTDDTEPLGKYGRMRLAYLKNQRPVLYNRMLLNGTLWPHLQDVQKTACAWLERTMTTLLDKVPCAGQGAHTASLAGAHERAESAG